MNADVKNKVFIKRVSEYDRDQIRAAVVEGMRALEYRPSGKVYVKPNAVVAHKRELMGEHGCTHRSVVGAAASALSAVPAVSRVDIGEKSGVGFPTRMSYKYAGYYDELAGVGAAAGKPVELFCIEEEPRDPVFIGGAVHDVLRVARKMARADTKVYLPKLKCHCVTNLTGAIKLNVGICSEDERSIRHDFMLNDKIVDLLAAGMPDFIVEDAIDVGVGNEGFPIYRKLGLLIMGRSPVAVDLIGARLLGLAPEQIPYLAGAIKRGYQPGSIEEVEVAGDLHSLAEVDAAAEAIKPYDDEYYRWQDVNKELRRLNSPVWFVHGPYNNEGKLCQTGCVMGLKMFMAAFEYYTKAGPAALGKAKTTTLIIGTPTMPVDCRGGNAILIGSCTRPKLTNVGKVMKVDKCFTTVSDMMIRFGARLGMRSPLTDPSYIWPIVSAMGGAAARKLVKGRYLQDIGFFVSRRLDKRI